MYRTRTAAMGSMGLSLLILSALTASYLFAQVKPFDYRGDTARVQGGIALTLKAGKYEISRTSYQILGKVQRGEFVKMEGFDLTDSPGDPSLPYQIYDVVVPPNIDWETLTLKYEEVEAQTLPGDHYIGPAPPMRARVGDEELVIWGEGKAIVDGKNMNIYGHDEFFPKEAVAILSQSQMRKWKFVRIGVSPVQYNPVSGKLRLVKSFRINLDFKRIGTKVFRSNPMLRDTVMDKEAAKRFINIKDAVEWYRYVPPETKEPDVEDPDYVIITTNDIVAHSTRLADFVAHKTSLGHSVQVVTEADYGGLMGQPPNGTAEKIRQWLINNHVLIGIHYVLLIGDPDPDDPADPGDSVGDVPMKMCWPWRTSYNYRESPTDYFYADLSGDWDADGDEFFGERVSTTNPITPDPAINPDTFSVRWTGRIEVDSDGLHRFVTSSDDGIRVIIDGITVIEDWTDHFPTTTLGSIDLTAGQHNITIEFYDNTGDAVIHLFMMRPGDAYYGYIDFNKLYHDVGGVWTPGGLDGEYFNNMDFTASALTRVDAYINFTWGTGDQGPGGVDFAPDVYVGRIPVYDADYATLDSILLKTINYETAAAPAWRHKFLFSAVYLWDPKSDYQLGEALKADFADPLGFTTYRIYEEDFGLVPPPECAAINPKDVDPAADCNMLQEWANGGGYGIMSWSTHGWMNSASHLMVSADNIHLDDTTPAFTFQGSCLNGHPETHDNLGYSLLAQGAIATVSASRVSTNVCFNYGSTPDPKPTSGYNANLTYHYLMRIMQDQSAGHALYITKANVNPISNWLNKFDYNIYGDPSCSLLRHYGGLVLLFDTSGSMSWRHDGTSPAPVAEQRITFAKEATYPFMELLNDHSNKRINFGIADFPPQPWDSTVGCNGQVVTPMTLLTDASKTTAVDTTIPGLTAQGSTPLLAGMDSAIGMFGTESNKSIVLLSDGYHNCPSVVDATDPDVDALVTLLNTGEIKVFTIGFGRPTDVDHPLLERLAADTGGEFHDVTTFAFNPATWDPATDLQATYKSILVDSLGLETAADPMGVIRGGETVVRNVRINEHDKCVSIFLSWVTSQPNRLGLKVKTSDGAYIPITATAATPGIHYHAGNTYKILTVDESFLRARGKVGPTPWKIEIDAGRMSSNESENYQYSVILNSNLKMATGFDKTTYGTGDSITLTAKITEAGRPVTGLSNVKVAVARPGESLGNWYAANKVTAENIEQIPEKKDNETLSLLQRKTLYLTDILKLSLAGAFSPATTRLYDDGSHGDALADDGIYTNRYIDTVKEGTYSFFFQAGGGTVMGNFFDREDLVEKYLGVNVDPDHFRFEVIPLGVGDVQRFRVTVTPMDALGNYLGPRFSRKIKLSATNSKFIGAIEDNLEGGYSQVLHVPLSVDVKDVVVKAEVKGQAASFNLADIIKKPRKPYSFSVHAGTTMPRGTFNTFYDPDYCLIFDVGYHFTPQLSAVALFGYNRFKAGSTLVSDTYWLNLSGNLKYEFSTNPPYRIYVNGGLGLYVPENGSNDPGFNIGAGVDYDLPQGWIFEAGVDYHRIFSEGDDLDFLVPHVGLIFRF